MNKDTGVFASKQQVLMIKIAKTMTFDEGLSVANCFFFSFRWKSRSPNISLQIKRRHALCHDWRKSDEK